MPPRRARRGPVMGAMHGRGGANPLAMQAAGGPPGGAPARAPAHLRLRLAQSLLHRLHPLLHVRVAGPEVLDLLLGQQAPPGGRGGALAAAAAAAAGAVEGRAAVAGQSLPLEGPVVRLGLLWPVVLRGPRLGLRGATDGAWRRLMGAPRPPTRAHVSAGGAGWRRPGPEGVARPAGCAWQPQQRRHALLWCVLRGGVGGGWGGRRCGVG
jgi:hypothetical protein